MARLANSAAHFYQRLQELYPQKLLLAHKSEQSSPFRRWTTGSGAGSSYRHHDPRTIFNKQMSEGSGISGGGAGGVARWSLGLEQLLADPAGAAAFAHFLDKEFAAENIRFWWSCEQFSQSPEDQRRSSLSQEIWQRHLAEGAPEPVNVDAAARRAAALRLHLQPAPVDLFQQAQKQIFNVMKFDSYPRFLRSAEHAECARASLRGAPPPYTALPGQPADTSKLKKSASNASERRRSGGASLLPWKRTASKERANPQDGANQQTLTDVVKSSQSTPGQCSLCRVVLPDGATSVVGVDGRVTVTGLVDRLLQRRNLVCSAYDVLLKDADSQNGGVVVDGASPSSVLAGREAVVERRCVVRLELCARHVSVRCRPQRRLRHVLRPVVTRYSRSTSHAVFCGDQPVSLDTYMQDLDGARLKVVEVNGDELSSSVTCPRNDEMESLSELALRTTIDNQSGTSATSSTSRGSGSPPPQSGASGVTGGAAGGSRVRAALRPGVPLLHHPPDFLENLRETQRARLLPPAPPPLPPKPTRV